jgi:hypothetical protein
VGTGEDFAFEFDTQGNPMQQVLGAIYSLERLDIPSRKALAPLLVKSLSWRGPLGQAFVSHLVGTKATSLRSIGDPRAWALEILGFPMGTVKPTRGEVMAQYRSRLRAVHPDHGGNEESASKSIGDLGEARRILIG